MIHYDTGNIIKKRCHQAINKNPILYTFIVLRGNEEDHARLKVT